MRAQHVHQIPRDPGVHLRPAPVFEVAGGVHQGVEDAIGFQLAIGLAGEVFREAGAAAEAKRVEIEVAMAAAINAQKKDADGIVMDSSSWVISGKNPAKAKPQ